MTHPMKAAELKVGDWITSAVCVVGHELGPSRVKAIITDPRTDTQMVQVAELFARGGDVIVHALKMETEVELCG